MSDDWNGDCFDRSPDGKTRACVWRRIIGAGFWQRQGCGRAICPEGARVACVDLSADAAEETAEIIRGEGLEAIAVAADVTELQSVSATVARTCEAFGGIDILHNNVGVTHMGGPIELDEESFRASVDLNIGSVYRTSRLCCR